MADKTSFIKLDRNILRWRWYKDANVFRIFIYLLITAAYKDTEINGITLRRGQCLTTYKELATINSLSLKAVRTAISKLIDTGEISLKRLSKGVIITITSFEFYQGHYNLAFFVDMRNEGNHFDEKGQSFFKKRAFTKTPEKPLDSLQDLELQQVVGAFTFDKKGNHFDEKGQSKEESKQRRNIMNSYYYCNNKNIYNNSTIAPASARARACAREAEEVVALYNTICIGLSRINSLSDRREQDIKERLEKYSLDQFKEMFLKAESSSYLKGKNARKWKATFDWLIEDENFAKVLDGNYDDPPEDTRNSSFTSEEFFEAALAKSYKNIGGIK